MKNVSAKGGDKGNGMSFEIGDVGNEAEEVMFNEFLLWDPELLTVVIDDGILMGVTVDGKGAGGSMKEVGKKVSYRYLWEK